MTDTVVDARDLFRARTVRLVPSGDPMADRIAETVMAHYPDAPDCVTEAFTAFVSRYAEQVGKGPDDLAWGWLWLHFVRLSGMAVDDGGPAA